MRAIAIGVIVGLAWCQAALAQTTVPADPFASGSPARGSAGRPGSAGGNYGIPGGAAAAGPAKAGPRDTPRPFVTRQNDMEIPFSVRPGSTPDNQPTAVRVFVSWDQGKTWHFYDERKPEEGRFRFRPKQDGEFWFATQTIDRSGRPDAADPRRPQLRLIVDSQRPQLLVQAHVQQEGEVMVAWSAADATLAVASLKLEYQDASNSSAPWQSVESSVSEPAAGTATGQASFRAAVVSKSINLRAEIADAAGNTAYFSQKLSLNPPAAPAATGAASYSPPLDHTATHWPDAAGQKGLIQNNTMIATDDHTPAETAVADDERVRVPNVVNNPFLGKGRLASTASAASPSNGLLSNASQSPTNTEELPLPTASPDTSGPYGYGNDPSRSESIPNSDVAGTVNAAEVMPAPQSTYEDQAPELESAGENVEAPLGQRPRLTNSRRFSLDYDVESVGPEGVEAVELWGTADGGRSWTRWGADPDRVTPFDVEVNGEATYGFRIVIVGKNGLATSTPQPGDSPDIWVGIDSTRPTARFTGASYGQGEAAGKLDIRWEAADANLSSRPITLSISDRPDGPFTPIAAGLPNTGQYFWEFDPRSPRQIYLRLEARDDAGNATIDQLTEPIKVEGLEPKGRIRGFNPVAETPRGAFKSPLFQ